MLFILLLIGEAFLSGANETHFWLSYPGWKSEFYNEASLDLYVNSFRAGGRFLLDAEKLRDTVTRIAITQRYLQYDGDAFDLWLGNFYTTLGNGLVLSSFEDKALRIDRNLDGGRLTWSNKWLAAGAVAGRMLNEDKVSRDEWLYAADITVSPLENLDIGAIYLRRDASEDSDTLFGRAFEEWAEQNLAARLWRFNLGAATAERFTWGRRTSDGWIGTENIKGFGINASLSYSQEGLGVLVEAKSYRGLRGGINAPPPCNPDAESINQGADEHGFQAVVNTEPWDWLWLQASYALAWDTDTADRSSLGRAGLETRFEFANHTFVPFFTWIDREIPGGLNPENDRLEAGLSYETLYGELSISAKAFYRRVTEAAEAWDEPHAQMEFSWRSFILAAGGVAQISDTLKLWPWASLRYNAYPFDITLAYGRFKGSYICKNGVCSWELPFEGLKADLTLYF